MSEPANIDALMPAEMAEKAEAVGVRAHLGRWVDGDAELAHPLRRRRLRRQAQLAVVLPHRRRERQPQRVRDVVLHRSSPR